MLSSSVYFSSENCIVEPLYGIKMKRTAKQRKQSVYNIYLKCEMPIMRTEAATYEVVPVSLLISYNRPEGSDGLTLQS